MSLRFAFLVGLLAAAPSFAQTPGAGRPQGAVTATIVDDATGAPLPSARGAEGSASAPIPPRLHEMLSKVTHHPLRLLPCTCVGLHATTYLPVLASPR